MARRKPAELRSWKNGSVMAELRGLGELTGCAEKKISFCDRMAPQMIAASYCLSNYGTIMLLHQAELTIQIPPCATAAVPT